MTAAGESGRSEISSGKLASDYLLCAGKGSLSLNIAEGPLTIQS
jgi:hypothetical protein